MSAMPEEQAEGRRLVPLSDKTRQVNQRGRVLVLGGAALLLGVFAGSIGYSLAAPINETTAPPLAGGADLAVVLAPITLAALGIERMIEMAWNLVESYLRAFVGFLAGRSEWLRWANDELKAARARLELLAEEGDPTKRVDDQLPTDQDALSQLIERAANDVALAEQRLAGLTQTQQYKDAKRVISIIFSLVLGILIATIIQLKMFALLGIEVNDHVDILVTGIAIGTGSAPVHSIIGILQQGKDVLEGAQGLLKTRSAEVRQTMQDNA